MSNEETAINLICDEFESRWQSDSQPLLAEFLAGENKQLGRGLAEELLKIDIHYRQKGGEEFSATQYRDLGDEVFELAQQILSDSQSDATIQPKSDAESNQSERETLTQAPQSQVSKSQKIGRYKLLQKIGEGGMGSVWMAEQEEPVKRRVALKLIKSELATDQDIARFEAERQAVAMMDHPNIAKVLDGGLTEGGTPYMVMELVKGIPLTEYCDSKKLSVDKRLNLFIPVCKAVQHAHQKGIIHRDLKPSNVIVGLYDGEAVPKVLDFGLAKSTSAVKLTDKTMFTEFGSILGTPK